MAAPKNFTEAEPHETAQLVYSQKAFGKTLDERALIVRLKGKKSVVFSWSMSGKAFGLDWTAEIKTDSKTRSRRYYELGAELRQECVDLLSEELCQDEIALVKKCVYAAREKWPALAERL